MCESHLPNTHCRFRLEPDALPAQLACLPSCNILLLYPGFNFQSLCVCPVYRPMRTARSRARHPINALQCRCTPTLYPVPSYRTSLKTHQSPSNELLYYGLGGIWYLRDNDRQDLELWTMSAVQTFRKQSIEGTPGKPPRCSVGYVQILQDTRRDPHQPANMFLQYPVFLLTPESS